MIGRKKNAKKNLNKNLKKKKIKKKKKNVKENGKLANVMKGVIIKCLCYFQFTGTYKNLNQKLQPENSTEDTKIL